MKSAKCPSKISLNHKLNLYIHCPTTVLKEKQLNFDLKELAVTSNKLKEKDNQYNLKHIKENWSVYCFIKSNVRKKNANHSK